MDKVILQKIIIENQDIIQRVDFVKRDFVFEP